MAGVRRPGVLAGVDLSPGEGREREDPDVIEVVGRAGATCSLDWRHQPHGNWCHER